MEQELFGLPELKVDTSNARLVLKRLRLRGFWGKQTFPKTPVHCLKAGEPARFSRLWGRLAAPKAAAL